MSTDETEQLRARLEALEKAIAEQEAQRRRIEAELAASGQAAHQERPAQAFAINSKVEVGRAQRGAHVMGLHIDHADHVEMPAPDHPKATPEELRRAYLKRVVRECGILRMLGLDTSAGQVGVSRSEDVHLESIYVHLDTLGAAPYDAMGIGKEGVARLRRTVERRRPQSALAVAARCPRLVLLGGAGSGKTVLSNYLALCLATRGLPPRERAFQFNRNKHLPDWPSKLAPLPLRVILRDLARELPKDTERGTADQLWQHIIGRLGPHTGFADLLKDALLGKDEVLVILDGLDEVSEGLAEHTAKPRQLVLQAVEEFWHCFPDARYLVTCRKSSYVTPWTLADFEAVELAEFDQEKRDRFCELWYAELARRGQMDVQKVPAKAKSLQRAIRRTDLARMAGNPLLLTVMALVHARETELPEARALLYEECVKVLLWLWERHKEEGQERADLLTLLDKGRVDRAFFMRTLDRLAYDVHSEGGSRPGEADIRAMALVGRLTSLHPQHDMNWARDVVQFIRQRAGLLIERRPDEADPLLAFPHRTFQEYLAACWLTEGEDTAKEAARLARLGDHWWEVIKLAAGRMLYSERKVAQPLALLDWLCPEDPPHDQAGWRLSRLAGEVLLELKPEQMCRDEMIRPKVATILERVRNRLVEAIGGAGQLDPRERAQAGDVLAQLGDPRRGVGCTADGKPDIVWVEVPEGGFLMGEGEEQHTVTLPTFYISRYPVTNAQFAAFVRAGGYGEKRYWTEAEAAKLWRRGAFKGWRDDQPRSAPVDFGLPFNRPNHPVVGVSWYEALAFCRWLHETVCGGGSLSTPTLTLWREGQVLAHKLPPGNWRLILPSEAEWEKAARGSDGREFPWGKKADPNKANYDETGIGSTSAVGCFPAGHSPCGALDMAGNIWEWTMSSWSKELPSRVVRGGSWINHQRLARCAYRFRLVPVYWYTSVGFRVVVSLAAPES